MTEAAATPPRQDARVARLFAYWSGQRDGRARRYQSLVLPLGRDGATVDMIMGAQVYLE